MPFSTDPVRIQNSLANIHDDWYEVRGQVIDDTDERSKLIPSWQFKVSILPTRENCLKALAALQTLEEFKQPHHPSFKLFIPSELSVQDERGKELCVSLEYSNQVYLKQLMLNIWKALQEAGVEMAYVAPDGGEKAIRTTDGSQTPFMYSSFKPHQQRPRMVHERHYNPGQLQDPLQGLRITPEDLAKHRIQAIRPDYIQHRINRQLQYYRHGVEQAQLKLTTEFEPDPHYSRLISLLEGVLDTYHQPSSQTHSPANLSSFIEALDQALDDRDFNPFPALESTNTNYFRQCREQLKNNPNEAQSALTQLQASLRAEKNVSIQELQNSLTYHEINTLSDDKLSSQFDRNPQVFQKITQSLILLQHENEAIASDINYMASAKGVLPTPSQTASKPGFFRRHALAIFLTALHGLSLGLLLGFGMGVVSAIPTGGASILATPFAMLILGASGLVGGLLLGVLGSWGRDLFVAYRSRQKVSEPKEDLATSYASDDSYLTMSKLGPSHSKATSLTDPFSASASEFNLGKAPTLKVVLDSPEDSPKNNFGMGAE